MFGAFAVKNMEWEWSWDLYCCLLQVLMKVVYKRRWRIGSSQTLTRLVANSSHSDCHLSCTRSFSSCWWSNCTTRLLELICSITSASAFHTAKNIQDFGMFERIDEKLGAKTFFPYNHYLQLHRHFHWSIQIPYISIQILVLHIGSMDTTSSLRSRNFWFNKNSFEARKNLGCP